jgi:tRNA (guanine6-N2)-methyltransferase
LLASAATGALSTLSGTPRYRVGPIGDARWPLIEQLRDAGWDNAPGDWHVNIERHGGTLIAEIGDLHWPKRFGELQRAPASVNTVIATVMARLAKIEPGHTVLDPFCGTATLLVAAGETTESARLLGTDHDARWVTAAGDNLARRGLTATLWRGDARRIPLPYGSVDRVLSNLPFGKRVGSHLGNQQLYPAALSEVARVLSRRGRAVLLTEDKRLFTQTVQRTRGLRVVKEVTFTTGGAHPSAYVLATRRGR